MIENFERHADGYQTGATLTRVCPGNEDSWFQARDALAEHSSDRHRRPSEEAQKARLGKAFRCGIRAASRELAFASTSVLPWFTSEAGWKLRNLTAETCDVYTRSEFPARLGMEFHVNGAY